MTAVTEKPKPKASSKKPSTGLTFTPSGHRYRLDGKPVTGVTTLLNGGVPKPALIRWAPRVVAEWVTDPEHRQQLDVLLAGDTAAAVRELAALPNKVRDSAGERGTAVHKLAEELHRTGNAEDIPDELFPYVDGYAKFLDDWQIKPVLMERPVANRVHWWSGTFDLLATSPFLAGGKLVQIDLKTSNGVYGETALQTAAYSRAEFYNDDAGAEQPMPEIHATYVAHVTPEGTQLYQLAGNPEQIDAHYQQFLAAAYIAKTAKQRGDIIGEPLTTHPETESEAS